MTTTKAVSVLLVAVLLASSFGSVSAGAGSENAAGNATDGTFYVGQGERCYEVAAVGSGEQNVSEFYDYRSGSGTLWGSYGEQSQAIQQNQVSHLFVYNGSEGLSLVLIHDALNGSKGGAVSVGIEGLPESREWVVEDDDYQNRDDVFDHGETSSTVHWMWADNRSDGAAVRGLGEDFETITIDARWGEDSWAYQNRSSAWPYATDDITDWHLLSGTGEEFSLEKDEPVTVRKAGCQATEAPTAALSVSSRNVTVNESVTFDAGESNGTAENATFRWDFDGDGDVDRETDDATVDHAYDEAGSYEATVTVVGEDGSRDDASTTIDVAAEDERDECAPEGETEETDESGDTN